MVNAAHEITPAPRPLRWDIFCRVIDNFGDLGVCWRLARQLAARGDRVRLVADDPSALAWMEPLHEQHEPAVVVLPWPGLEAGATSPERADGAVGDADIVIEAFGCDLPPAALEAMRATGPVWINLEYLSAEDYVERSHGLPSPRADGLRKWFFYPGFTPRTGGLLREAGLMERRAAFERDRWLADHGLRLAPGERAVSLFCYENPGIPALLKALAAQQPTLLLLTPGAAQRQVPEGQPLPPGLRTARLPWLSQVDFDHLLWSCDLNCVRGEDSLVRALWAGEPFLWQAYPQADEAHATKVQAAWHRLGLPLEVAPLWQAWNGLGPWPASLPAHAPWRRAVECARAQLLRQDDLATQLRQFALERLRPAIGPALASAPANSGC